MPARSPRITVLTAMRTLARRVRNEIRVWDQERTTYDLVSGNAVWRPLTEGEKVENRAEAWTVLIADTTEMINQLNELRALAREQLHRLEENK